MNTAVLRGKSSTDSVSAAPRRERPADDGREGRRAGGTATRGRSVPMASDRGPVSRPQSIDALDERIIQALQENGRASFRRIAGRVGVTEATVRARYARLTTDNVVRVTGVTNPLALGFDGMALVGIKVSGVPEPVADEV